MRRILPTAAIGLLMLLALMVATHELRTRASAPRDTVTQIRMVNPRFLGRDSQGRAFEVNAAQAARSDGNLQEVILDRVVVTLDVGGPAPRRLSADRGVYREDTRILRLTSNVHLDDGRASSFTTNEAVVDTGAGTVRAGAQRSGANSDGRVHARIEPN